MQTAVLSLAMKFRFIPVFLPLILLFRPRIQNAVLKRFPNDRKKLKLAENVYYVIQYGIQNLCSLAVMQIHHLHYFDYMSLHREHVTGH